MATPPADPLVIHGRSHVGVGRAVVLDGGPLDGELDQRGLEEVLCILAIPGEEQCGAQQRALAGSDILADLCLVAIIQLWLLPRSLTRLSGGQAMRA